MKKNTIVFICLAAVAVVLTVISLIVHLPSALQFLRIAVSLAACVTGIIACIKKIPRAGGGLRVLLFLGAVCLAGYGFYMLAYAVQLLLVG